MTMTVRPLIEADIPAASRINRLAFGTFFGLPDPMKFRADAGVVEARFRSDPDLAFAAEIDGVLVGTHLGQQWGRFGILGPITVLPEYWSQGVARALLPAAIERFEANGSTTIGLFTHPQSTRHVRLYESFGFALQRITGVMSKPVAAEDAALPPGIDRLSASWARDRAGALASCRSVSDTLYPGLDLAREIAAVLDGNLGDVLLLRGDVGAAGFAVCHHGKGSDAGSPLVLVKFAAVPVGRGGAAARFSALLAGCEAFAASRGVAKIVAGTNSGRTDAYRILQARGYRSDMNGVAMLRPDGDGYNRPEVYAIDDWR